MLSKTQTGYFQFLLIKENCHNRRISDDINMKLGTETKIDKRTKITSTKLDDEIMLLNFDVIVICPIYGQLGAIWKPDSGCTVCKTYIFILYLLLSHTSETIADSKVLFLSKKILNFCKKVLT